MADATNPDKPTDNDLEGLVGEWLTVPDIGERFGLRLSDVRQMIEDRRPACELAIEGGIDSDNAYRAADAGADILVAGSSVFGCPAGVGAGVRRLLDAARGENRGSPSGRPFTM